MQWGKLFREQAALVFYEVVLLLACPWNFCIKILILINLWFTVSALTAKCSPKLFDLTGAPRVKTHCLSSSILHHHVVFLPVLRQGFSVDGNPLQVSFTIPSDGIAMSWKLSGLEEKGPQFLPDHYKDFSESHYGIGHFLFHATMLDLWPYWF